MRDGRAPRPRRLTKTSGHFWRNEPTLRKRNSSATKETRGTTMSDIVRVHAARRESLRMSQAAFCNELLDQACAFRRLLDLQEVTGAGHEVVVVAVLGPERVIG